MKTIKTKPVRTAAAVLAAALVLTLVSVCAPMPGAEAAFSSADVRLMDGAEQDLAQRAQAQGVVLPADFTAGQPVYGQMYNDSGTGYYAVYQYRDPNNGSPEYRFGTFWFPNPNVPSTANCDANVILYGYYNGFGLFDSYGTLFWCTPMYFHPEGGSSNVSPLMAQLIQKAQAQNVVLPQGMMVIQPIDGAMHNYSGTDYYAVSKYKDPAIAGDLSLRYGTFSFPCASNPNTVNYDGSVTVYAYYKGYGLYEHYGELFWAATDYFHSGQLSMLTDWRQAEQLATSQGVVIPQDFTVVQPSSGTMFNDTGSIHYAVYKFLDPNNDDIAISLGTYWFPNTTNPNTTGCDGKVKVYGSYKGYGLFEHYGEFFWASMSFYHRGESAPVA